MMLRDSGVRGKCSVLHACPPAHHPRPYTAPFTFGTRIVQARTTDFGAGLWTCSIDQNKEFFRDISAPTLSPRAK